MAEPDAIASEETDPDLPVIYKFDPALMEFVRLINALGGTEVGVTLHVGGSVVSGALISGTRFFDLLIKTLKDPQRGAASEALADWFQPWLDTNLADARAHDEDETHIMPAPSHIHLRQASTVDPQGGKIVAPLWRGRLSSVSGWSLGNLGEIPPLDQDEEI